MAGKPPFDGNPPGDDALWRAVVQSVRPLASRPAPPPAAQPRPSIQVRPHSAAPPAPRPSDRLQPDRTQLDGSWDRRIRTGRLEPEIVIDLHGFNLAQSHRELATALRQAWTRQMRVVLVITGKGGRLADGRGTLRTALPLWLEAADLRGYVAALRAAHPRHGGAGAWYVILRRQREPAGAW